MARRNQTASVVLLLAFIGLPLLFTFLPFPRMELREKRAKAPPPQLPISAFDRFPAELTAFFNDRFGLREPLIVLGSVIELHLLRRVSNPQVTVGSEGWYYYFYEDYQRDYARGTKSFDEAGLENLRASAERTAARLKRIGKRYLLVVAPEKSTIYPEHLPSGFLLPGGKMRLRQFSEFIRERPAGFEWLDLSDTLLAAKREARVFQKTDSHWNDLGAHFAARAIVQRLRSMGLDDRAILGAPEREDLVESVEDRPGGDTAELLAAQNFVRERETFLAFADAPAMRSARWLWRRTMAAERVPVAIQVDSFGWVLMKQLARYVPAIRPKQYVDGSNPTVDYRWAKQTGAALVIQEITERNLERIGWAIPPELLQAEETGGV